MLTPLFGSFNVLNTPLLPAIAAPPGYLNSIAWIQSLIFEGNVFSDEARTTPASTPGETVSSIRDLSANANHAIPATATANIPSPTLPILAATATGKAALDFNSTSRGLQFNDITFTGDFTRIHVVRSIATTTGMYGAHASNVNPKEGRQNNNYFARPSTNTGTAAYGIALNTWGLVIWQRSAGVTSVRFNDGAPITLSTDAGTSVWNLIGRAGDSSTQYWRGQIAVSLSLPRALTNDELAGVKSELNSMCALY